VSIESGVALGGLARLRVSGLEGYQVRIAVCRSITVSQVSLANGLFLSYELSFIMLTVMLLSDFT